MQDFIARLRVIATAAVTWLTAAALIIPFAANEIANQLDTDSAAVVVRVAGVAVGWIGAAVAIIRRVTPVPASERGVIPPSS